MRCGKVMCGIKDYIISPHSHVSRYNSAYYSTVHVENTDGLQVFILLHTYTTTYPTLHQYYQAGIEPAYFARVISICFQFSSFNFSKFSNFHYKLTSCPIFPLPKKRTTQQPFFSFLKMSRCSAHYYESRIKRYLNLSLNVLK